MTNDPYSTLDAKLDEILVEMKLVEMKTDPILAMKHTRLAYRMGFWRGFCVAAGGLAAIGVIGLRLAGWL